MAAYIELRHLIRAPTASSEASPTATVATAGHTPPGILNLLRWCLLILGAVSLVAYFLTQVTDYFPLVFVFVSLGLLALGRNEGRSTRVVFHAHWIMAVAVIVVYVATGTAWVGILTALGIVVTYAVDAARVKADASIQ